MEIFYEFCNFSKHQLEIVIQQISRPKKHFAMNSNSFTPETSKIP